MLTVLGGDKVLGLFPKKLELSGQFRRSIGLCSLPQSFFSPANLKTSLSIHGSLELRQSFIFGACGSTATSTRF